MGDLPDSRLEFGTPPFRNSAMDLFGPLEIGLTRNRTAKRWGVLFTCLVTRAVFVDLVLSLGELQEAAEQLYASPEITAHFKKKRIEWTFQPPRTPHFGGAHESLVRSTKRAMYRALEEEKLQWRYPTEDTLRTILFEVSGLLNCRPLTYVSSDPTDFRPLCPNDFLNRPSTLDPPAGSFDDADPREQYRYLQWTLNLFWDIWKSSYLHTLVSRKKWKTPQRNFAVGDVIMTVETGLVRGQWSIGHVVKIFPGSDGLVRVVDVQLPTGVFRRGINQISLLEPISTSPPVPSSPVSGEHVPAKAIPEN